MVYKKLNFLRGYMSIQGSFNPLAKISNHEQLYKFIDNLTLSKETGFWRVFCIKDSTQHIDVSQIIDKIKEIKGKEENRSIFRKIEESFRQIFKEVDKTDRIYKELFAVLELSECDPFLTISKQQAEIEKLKSELDQLKEKNIMQEVLLSQNYESRTVQIAPVDTNEVLDDLHKDTNKDFIVCWRSNEEGDTKIEKEKGHITSLDEEDVKGKNENLIKVHGLLLRTIPYFKGMLSGKFLINTKNANAIYIDLPVQNNVKNLHLLYAVLYDQPIGMTFSELTDFYVFCNALQWEKGMKFCNKILFTFEITFSELLEFHLLLEKVYWEEGEIYCNDFLSSIGSSEVGCLIPYISKDNLWKEFYQTLIDLLINQSVESKPNLLVEAIIKLYDANNDDLKRHGKNLTVELMTAIKQELNFCSLFKFPLIENSKCEKLLRLLQVHFKGDPEMDLARVVLKYYQSFKQSGGKAFGPNYRETQSALSQLAGLLM